MSSYHDDFLNADDPFPLMESFIREKVIPHVEKQLADFGDDWMHEIDLHTREIQALLDLIAGRVRK